MVLPAQPAFEELPLNKSGPPGNAWGLYGPDDDLGRLNLLTPEAVVAAAQEIREGLRIRIDWPLDRPSFPTFERKQFEHAVLAKDSPAIMNDDTININTQSSTQWDGFRHFGVLFVCLAPLCSHTIQSLTTLFILFIAYQRTKQFFMGHTQKDFEKGSTTLGIDCVSSLPRFLML